MITPHIENELHHDSVLIREICSSRYRSSTQEEGCNHIKHDSNQQKLKKDLYPPYNIEQIDAYTYRIVLAIAGFTREHITLTKYLNRLQIVGQPMQQQDKDNPPAVLYLHKGIAMRGFIKIFELEAFIQVQSVRLQQGLLIIALRRQLPLDTPQALLIEDETSPSESHDQQTTLTQRALHYLPS